MSNNFISGFIPGPLIHFLLIITLTRCADADFFAEAPVNAGATLQQNVAGTTLPEQCLDCSYIVAAGQTVVDGRLLGIRPGDVIGLNAKVSYGPIVFRNLKGTHDQPIVIRNFGGTVYVDGSGMSYAIKTEGCEFFRITGGDLPNTYGIVVNGGKLGVTLDNLSTNFEVDHLEIMNSGFAGIMAKTDPGCDDAATRDNFIMKKVDIRDNFIHDTGGEGIYAGNSFFTGMKTACGIRLPHEIHYIRIFRNVVRNTGWDGIQLGSATKGASVHANVIENYGLANVNMQNNGIQIGTGTGGVCNNNHIKNGTGTGIIVLGLGDNVIYNNIIENAGNFGVFCDERYSPGPGFIFLNNTILNPKSDGIRLYADKVPENVIANNIIVNPGSYTTYTYPRTPEDAFVYTLSKYVNVTMLNNYFTTEKGQLGMTDAAAGNFRVSSLSPIVDMGADIAQFYSFRTDFYYKSRLKGQAYDIGAVEHF